MGIFSRLATLIKSNLNDLISRSEDPEKMLNQIVLEMNNQLVEAKKQVAASIADEKRLAKQCEQEIANAQEWERRAMMALRALNDKIEEAKRKKNVLVARKKRAEAQKSIQETMSGLRDQSAFETFDRMSQKIDQLEAEAEAQADLAEEYSGDTLASQFQNLERNAGADEDLTALKRKMGLLPPEEAKAPAAPIQARVEAPAPTATAESERDELAAAL